MGISFLMRVQIESSSILFFCLMGLLLTTPLVKKLGFPLRSACLIHGRGEQEFVGQGVG